MGQQRRALTPQRSPLHLWGCELRAWRDRRGLSLCQLGERIFYDAAHLGKFERGERVPPRHIAEACDRELDSGGVLIRLWALIGVGSAGGHGARSAADRAKSATDGADPAANLADRIDEETASEANCVPLPVLHDGRVVFVSVSRRAILKLAGVAATAAVVPSSAARPDAPLVLAPDTNPIDHLAAMRRVLIDNDNLFGPRSVIPTVRHQINVMNQIKANLDGGDRRKLVQVQASYAEFCGWLHQDVGDFQAAQYWLDRALEWAYAGGDVDLATYVFARKAQLAGDMNDPIQAVDMGQAAAGMARTGTRLEAIAAVYTGHGYAMQNNPTAAARSYEHARVRSATAPVDPESPWGVWLDEAYINVHEASSLDSLGKHLEAAERFGAAINIMPAGYHRDRGVYLARQAAAYAGAGQPDRAAHVAVQALAVGSETQSARILTELVRLDGQLGKWHSAPGVSDFHDLLTELVPVLNSGDN